MTRTTRLPRTFAGGRSSTLSKAARVWPASTPPPTATIPIAWPQRSTTGTWPEFNEMIGGFFKFHWTYPTLIPVKIDDPHSPLTVMFPPRGFDIVDETYTFAQTHSAGSGCMFSPASTTPK